MSINARVYGLIALLTASPALPGIMAVSPSEQPKVLLVTLSKGSKAKFTLDADSIVRIDLEVNNSQITVSLEHCSLPPNLHLESFELLREDLREDKHRQDGYTLLFDVGSEQDRKFGRLPRVQLSFVGGKLVASYLTTQTGPNSGFSRPLCDVPPNKLPEHRL